MNASGPSAARSGTHTMAFTGAVLAGGASTRMGRDKAQVTVAGVPMGARVVEALWAAGASEVIVVGGDPSTRAGLGGRVVADRFPGQGPLGGLLSALTAARHDLVVVCACDLPWLDAATITRIVDAEAGAAVAMAVTDRREPLCARWDRRVASAPLEVAFAAGERAIHRALGELQVFEVHVDARPLTNVNTPQDLAVASGAMSLPEISVDELAARLPGGAVLFDVRMPDEYEQGHVPSARLVPLPEVPERVGEFPTDGEVLVICRSGARSASAVEFLRANGIDAVNVAGGTLAWIDRGRAVETGGAA